MKNAKWFCLFLALMAAPMVWVGDVPAQKDDETIGAGVRRSVEVMNYAVTTDDPNDWVCSDPAIIQLVVSSHYHYFRTGADSVDFNGPAGANSEDLRYLPEGDNSPGSNITVGDPRMLDEATFICEIDARNTKRGDNFILYFRTHAVETTDWRWPRMTIPGQPRSFQLHLHIGPDWKTYVRQFSTDEVTSVKASETHYALAS